MHDAAHTHEPAAQRHRPSTLTVFGAAFVAGAVAAFGINSVLDSNLVRTQPQVECEPIFVALRSLPQGTPVTVWDVALRDWPRAMLPQTALRAEDTFEGLILRHPLREGQPLLSVQLAQPEAGVEFQAASPLTTSAVAAAIEETFAPPVPADAEESFTAPLPAAVPAAPAPTETPATDVFVAVEPLDPPAATAPFTAAPITQATPPVDDVEPESAPPVTDVGTTAAAAAAPETVPTLSTLPEATLPGPVERPFDSVPVTADPPAIAIATPDSAPVTDDSDLFTTPDPVALARPLMEDLQTPAADTASQAELLETTALPPPAAATEGSGADPEELEPAAAAGGLTVATPDATDGPDADTTMARVERSPAPPLLNADGSLPEVVADPVPAIAAVAEPFAVADATPEPALPTIAAAESTAATSPNGAGPSTAATPPAAREPAPVMDQASTPAALPPALAPVTPLPPVAGLAPVQPPVPMAPAPSTDIAGPLTIISRQRAAQTRASRPDSVIAAIDPLEAEPLPVPATPPVDVSAPLTRAVESATAAAPRAERSTVVATPTTPPRPDAAREIGAPAAVATTDAPATATAEPTPAEPQAPATGVAETPATVPAATETATDATLPPATASLAAPATPPAAESTAPEPLRYLVVPERIAMQVDTSFVTPQPPSTADATATTTDGSDPTSALGGAPGAGAAPTTTWAPATPEAGPPQRMPQLPTQPQPMPMATQHFPHPQQMQAGTQPPLVPQPHVHQQRPAQPQPQRSWSDGPVLRAIGGLFQGFGGSGQSGGSRTR